MRALVVAAVIAGPGTAAAQEGTLSHASLIVGVAQNSGSLGDHFRYGFLGGTEAGVQRRFSEGAIWDLGLAWSLTYGYYPASGDREVDSAVEVVELEALGRGRVRLPGPVPAFLVAEVGGDLYRASLPVPPSDEQMYFGLTAGGGAEIDLGKFVLSIGTRFGPFLDGPSGMRLFFRGGFGL